MVLLIGNYSIDRQQSMQRFATMMLDGLTAAKIPAELIQPEPFLGRIKFAGNFVTKWLGYLDKIFFFRRDLRRRLQRASLVHICDHSNAFYARWVQNTPLVVTCHDLLAVRGGLGEATDCPASFTGKYLQRWILRGLQRATAVACVSRATLRDAERLIDPRKGRPEVRLIPNGLNYPYHQQPLAIIQSRLAGIDGFDLERPFVLHVGSNLRRKNREGVLRIFSRTKEMWNGRLVLAGEPLTPELRSLGRDLGITDRLVEVVETDSEILEALYSAATALVFPSRFEGFGWPVIEAQACGCPVICSDREPLPEVAGAGGLIHEINDEAAFARDVLRLTDPVERQTWSEKSLQNALRFSAAEMIAHYVELYRSLGVHL